MEKCGTIDEAHEPFDRMPPSNVGSQKAMIAGYAQNEFTKKCPDDFNQMQLAGVKICQHPLACVKMGALEQGVDVHHKINSRGILLVGVAAIALAVIYTKYVR